ncbi:MAG: hypothetical protein WC251_05970 [Candidatus Izemoplasmatales bacterium]|jgi:DNA polymerase-3 subunit delta'|nr:hypothetical protein [Candidatus Izemoplasmatales bacterium]
MTAFTWDRLEEYQPVVAKMLLNSLKQGLTAHAYILEGAKGTKRVDTAILFAKTLLCKNLDDNFNPCGVCHNCTRIDHLSHPNVFYVSATGEQIRKKQIKELLTEFSRASVEEGPRIYIIDEAEKLNQESSNTLLKTMEEPGAEIYQVLLTTQPTALMKTIISRAQILHFKPIDRKKIKQDLLLIGVSPRLASAISESTFNTDMAIKMSQDDKTEQLVDLAFTIFQSFFKRDSSPILLFKDAKDLVLESGDAADFFLGVMIFIMKDVLNQKFRHRDLIVFDSETGMTEKIGEKIPQKIIEEQIGLMLELKAKLKYNNINSNLAFDKMLACLERGIVNGLSCSTGSI